MGLRRVTGYARGRSGQSEILRRGRCRESKGHQADGSSRAGTRRVVRAVRRIGRPRVGDQCVAEFWEGEAPAEPGAHREFTGAVRREPRP